MDNSIKNIRTFQLDHPNSTNLKLEQVLANCDNPIEIAFKCHYPLAVYKRIKADEFDLIIITYEMPLVTGDRVIKMIRSTGIIAPIVAVSNDYKIRELMLNAGADFFISKYDNPDQITHTLLKPFQDAQFRRNNLYCSNQ